MPGKLFRQLAFNYPTKLLNVNSFFRFLIFSWTLQFCFKIFSGAFVIIHEIRVGVNFSLRRLSSGRKLNHSATASGVVTIACANMSPPAATPSAKGDFTPTRPSSELRKSRIFDLRFFIKFSSFLFTGKSLTPGRIGSTRFSRINSEGFRCLRRRSNRNPLVEPISSAKRFTTLEMLENSVNFGRRMVFR